MALSGSSDWDLAMVPGDGAGYSTLEPPVPSLHNAPAVPFIFLCHILALWWLLLQAGLAAGRSLGNILWQMGAYSWLEEAL